MPVAGGLALAIRLRFHNHAPQQRSLGLAFHQQKPMSSGATCSAGRQKKDWGRGSGSAGRVLVAMGVALEGNGLGHIAAPGTIRGLQPLSC